MSKKITVEEMDQFHSLYFSLKATIPETIGREVPRAIMDQLIAIAPLAKKRKALIDSFGFKAGDVVVCVQWGVEKTGLVVGSTYQTHRVRHVGANALADAIEAARLVGNQTAEVAEKIVAMQSTQLTLEQQRELANAAAQLVLPKTAVNFNVHSILRPRRAADTNSDVWSVFNRVQENVVRGGLQYVTVADNGAVRHGTGRSIKAIDRSVDLNQKLWAIAEQFANVA